ncbi:efflux RND transporter periplasmic adaptor subunit [Helicobacter cynogastricus]|uniref:efflux RND transporter periplasmic adaptor subunit n=1 Tax=Helicobacter cynogastricus TaxID=329937 RepID=UPI000CF04CDB|nr:efflux RND transporter periplasmic adaptor subunit [Helicobacter cynogastricus]
MKSLSLCLALLGVLWGASDTIKVTLKESAPFRQYYASLQADEQKSYSYTLRFDGFVEKLYADQTYKPIKAGERLFSIYSPSLVGVQSELLSALHFNRQVEEIKEKLRLLGVGQLEIARLIKEGKIINSMLMRSRFNGIIFTKNIQEGGFIKGGTEVYRIIDLSSLYAIAKINQEDLDFVRHLAKASISIEGVPGVFSLDFSNINPLVNDKDKMLEARFILKNPQGVFFPNMFARITIYQRARKMLVLPKEAVLVKNDKTIVFKKEDGDFEITEIHAKRNSDGSYEILEGLKEGDEVAKNALFILDADAINNGDE